MKQPDVDPALAVTKKFKMQGYNVELMNSLDAEVKKMFERANRQVHFNTALPYELELQKKFGGVLDDSLFVPLEEVPTLETTEQGVLDVY